MTPRAVNPYAPKSKATPAGEKESQLATFTRRLRLLGASAEMIEDVRENWDNFDEQWTPEFRARFVRKGDDDLRDHIAAVQEEWVSDTTDEAAQQADERHEAELAAIRAAEGRIGGTVASITEWVDGEAVRAWAVQALECEGTRRPTLLAAVGPLADQWTADGA